MESNGIWTLEEAKKEHQFDSALAIEIASICNMAFIIYDFGCGKGEYLDYLDMFGFGCVGFEGTENIKEIAIYDKIVIQDLSKPFQVDFKGTVMSLEVAEHVPKEFEQTFIQNLVNACNGKLIISWAIPGQRGHGHVNERDYEYVVKTFTDLGFELNKKETDYLRKSASLWWFKKSIYVFDKI
jgi:hypothetical protein